jgi:hypothetical protein
MRAELRTIGCSIAEFDVPHALGEHRLVSAAPSLHYLTVEVKDPRATGALVKIVDVLRYNRDLKERFKFLEGNVRGVWLRSCHSAATFVIESQDSTRVTPPPFRSCNFINGHTLPETPGAAKCG